MNYENERGKILALTGHRDLPENFDKNRLMFTLEEYLRGGFDYFLCGMARGFDLTALEILRYLKQKYRFRIEACIPFAGQEKSYPAEEKKKYRALLEWCDEKTTLSPSYFAGCFLKRDCYMVNTADELLAYCKKNTGGTAFTVKEAEKRGIKVTFLE